MDMERGSQKNRINDVLQFVNSQSLENDILTILQHVKETFLWETINTRKSPLRKKRLYTRSVNMPFGDWHSKLAGLVSLACDTRVISKQDVKQTRGRPMIHLSFEGAADKTAASVQLCEAIYKEVSIQSGILRRKIVTVLRDHSSKENRNAVRSFMTAYCMGIMKNVESRYLCAN